jgi:hypothetical protein
MLLVVELVVMVDLRGECFHAGSGFLESHS